MRAHDFPELALARRRLNCQFRAPPSRQVDLKGSRKMNYRLGGYPVYAIIRRTAQGRSRPPASVIKGAEAPRRQAIYDYMSEPAVA